jgi:hypothetical protein
VARQLRGEDRQVESLALTSHQLRHTPARLGRIHHAVTAKFHGVVNRLVWIGLDDTGHHIVADIDPAPPGIVEVDPLQRRELAVETLLQKRQMLRVFCVMSGDGTNEQAASLLNLVESYLDKIKAA